MDAKLGFDIIKFAFQIAHSGDALDRRKPGR